MKKLLTNRILIAILALLTGLFIVFQPKTQPENVTSTQSLTDIQDIDMLRTQFNLDAGKTRLVILVSPT